LTKHKTIMLAEPNTQDRLKFREVIDSLGCTADEASDGAFALEHLQKFRPDLLIACVDMPGVDGFTLCEFFRANPALKDVPVILTARIDDDKTRERARSVGAADLVSKTIDPVILSTKIRRCLEGIDEWGGDREATRPLSSAVTGEKDPFSSRIAAFIQKTSGGQEKSGHAEETAYTDPEESADAKQDLQEIDLDAADPTDDGRKEPETSTPRPRRQSPFELADSLSHGDLSPPENWQMGGIPGKYLDRVNFGLVVFNDDRKPIYANRGGRKWLNLLDHQNLEAADDEYVEVLISEGVKVCTPDSPLFVFPYKGHQRETLGLQGRIRMEECISESGDFIGYVMLIWAPQVDGHSPAGTH